MVRSPEVEWPVNSRQWWDHYFRHEWDRHGGAAQTAHFMERLIASLPPRERAWLEAGGRTILDWGCAFGEGVALLARAFPGCQVWGLDFSWVAVEQARRRHPGLRFIHDPEGELPAPFDVLVTSNCLEHFDDPLAIVRQQMEKVRDLYILLVPNEEAELHYSHRIALAAAAFPAELGPFVRLEAAAVEVDPACWKGSQLLVVYGSREYVKRAAAGRGHSCAAAQPPAR